MGGREWRPKGEPVQVEDHSFFTGPDVEQAIPYGIYDITRDAGCVIHAATMRPREKAMAESLKRAIRSSLLCAEGKGIRSLAFPALGTGAAGFPLEECASRMLSLVLEHIKVRTCLEKIYFVLFDDAALKVFEEAYQKLTAPPAAKPLQI